MTTTIEFTPAELEAANEAISTLLDPLPVAKFWPAITQLQAENTRLRAERKLAPVQGYSAGIPWAMHLRAYDAYCKKHGEQQALIEGWCRGGFGTGELDMFIPGWRDELSELTKLKAERDQLAELMQKLAQAAEDVLVHISGNPHNISVNNLRHYVRRAEGWIEAHK